VYVYVCVYVCVSPSFWRVVFPFLISSFGIFLNNFLCAGGTITAHNGQLLWTVKRTMELPRLSLMSNRQTVRFTASGQTAGPPAGWLCTSLCSLLRLGGLKPRLVLLKCVGDQWKKFVFVEGNVEVERWCWCCLLSKSFCLCAVCQWHLAYTAFSNCYIEALIFSINLLLSYAKLMH